MNRRRRAVLVMPDADLAASLEDAEAAAEDHEIVALVGNGVGWYAALAFAGVISPDDAQRLVRELAALAADSGSPTAQVVYPLTDAAWRPDPRLAQALDGAMAVGDGQIHRSVDLGAYAVLSGTPAGVELLTSALPTISVGEHRYPLQLPARAPLYTPLVSGLAAQLRDRLADVPWKRSRLTLIDGRGVRHTPWSANPSAMRDETFRQLVDTVHFATALRVALREYAPDVLIVPGSGGILPMVCGQLVVAEGYRGIRSRRSFADAQRRNPVILSMRR